MRNVVLLYVNGRRVEVAGGDVFLSLTTYLREKMRLVGTKVVCAEGDCGSCTVLIGRVDEGGRLKYRSVCGCIQCVGQLDGAHVVTVEGLGYGEGRLNPVQQAMVEKQGSQCGFCTPGFVVSMCGMFEERGCAGGCFEERELRRGLVGNLCRCTGYESILAAGMAVDGKTMKRMGELFDEKAIARELGAADGEEVEVRDAGRIFFKPVTVAQAARFRGQNAGNGGCVILSGGTDLGVQVNKGMREWKAVMTTCGLRELELVMVEKGAIVAGARAVLSDLEAVAMKALPEFGRMLNYFGSPPIKNAGTIGGNIANGSPIGDTMPAMFVLNGEVELAGVNSVRRVNINEFYTGYRKNVMAGDEMITRVVIPLPRAGELFKVYKVSKRKDLDISTFAAAVWMNVAGGVIEEARIAYGGVGPVIMRMRETEAYLKGKSFGEETFAAAGAVARGEIKPISDVRGAADYRLALAENILMKFYFETASAAHAGVLA